MKKKIYKESSKKKKKCPNTIGQIPERSSKISKEGPKISKEVLNEKSSEKIGQNDQKKLIFSQFSLEIFGLSLEFLGPSLGILELLSGICPIVFGHFFFFLRPSLEFFLISLESQKCRFTGDLMS